MTEAKGPKGSLDAFANVDPLGETYRENLTNIPAVIKSIEKQDTALLVIDVQYLDAAPGHGVFAEIVESSAAVPEEAQRYYFDRLDQAVLPNIQRLQTTFRARGMEVIHTRIMSLTANGRDRSPGHKRLGLHAAPGSKESMFIESVAPVGDEIVVNKTASGVFTTTNIHYVLKNLGISGLFVTGVYTNECVSTAIRDGCDLGYHMTLIEDATATVTPELQESSVKTLKDRYCRVLTCEEAVREVADLVEQVGHAP